MLQRRGGVPTIHHRGLKKPTMRKKHIHTQPARLGQVIETIGSSVVSSFEEEVFPTVADTYIFMENVFHRERIKSLLPEI